VTFTNTLDPGTIEVCKQIVTGSGLTGTFTFTVTGSNGFTTTTPPVEIGACTSPITVPAGFVKVVETGDNAENVTAITATKTASNVDAVVGPNPTAPKYDLPTATVVVSVDPGDASMQTIVTFTNNSVRLKLCKTWEGNGVADPAATTGYPFAFTYSGPAGPNTGPASLNLVAGTEVTPNCVIVGGPYRAGTQVVVTEGIVPGTKVEDLGDAGSPGITVNPSGNQVDSTANAPNRTVTVTLGAGETVVTFEDVPALRGTLKICKAVTTTPPLIPPGTMFSFTLTPVAPTTGVPQTVLVPSGSCVVVGTFAFNSTWTVTEAAQPSITVAAITAVPSFVVVLENGLAVNSNEPVLTGTNTATRSTNVTIGENNITELTFTNTDPPNTGSTVGTSGGSSGGGAGGSGGSTVSGGSSGSSSPGGGSSSSSSGGGSSSSSSGGGASGGSSGGGGASSSSDTSGAPLTPAIAAVTSPAIIGTSLGLGSSASSKTATASELKLEALLTKLRTELAVNKATLKRLVAQRAAATTLARKHLLAKRIAAIQLADRKLTKEIKQLS
jgi:hypothetical protein